jgi:drug/metabolite transporter (DMT)-like permease
VPSTFLARLDPRLLPVAAAILAPLTWSIGGVVMRSVETAGAWEQASWRALGGALALALLLAPRGGGRVAADIRAAGWAGLASMACVGGSFVVHVLAMNATSVANVLFLQTASPLLMPLLAWLVLRERPQMLTVAAAAIAIAGLAPIVAASAGQGRIAGDLLALLSAACGAINVLIVRRMRGIDLIPTTTAAALLAAIVAASFGSALGVSAGDAVALLALGALQIAVGLKLFFFALRHLPAAPVALLTLLEPVAGPLLVWAIVGEVPPDATLLGGAIVGAAMLLSITAAGRSARRGVAAS